MSDTFNVTLKEIKELQPEVAVLPWGATEAHNYHLPYSTDVTEAFETASHACSYANSRGGKTVCYPAIPFGSNAQQLDQYITVSLSVSTIYGILEDTVSSLTKQGIKKLVIANFHGGNEFKPFIRDLCGKYEIFILLLDLFKMIPEKTGEIFENAGDHAGELETSLMMYLAPESVKLKDAGEGNRNPFTMKVIGNPGVWTPRPWSKTHPDTGAGNPEMSGKEKGKLYFESLVEETGKILLELSDTPFEKLP